MPCPAVLAHANFSKSTHASDVKAIAYIERVVLGGSGNIDDYLFLAHLYIHTKQDREAIQVLEKARIVSPYFREVYESLANEYLLLGRYGETLKVVKKGIELFPEDFALRQLEKKTTSVMLGPAN